MVAATAAAVLIAGCSVDLCCPPLNYSYTGASQSGASRDVKGEAPAGVVEGWQAGRHSDTWQGLFSYIRE